MNLRSWINKVMAVGFAKVIFGQSRRAGLFYPRPMMFLNARAPQIVVCLGLALLALSPSALFAQTNYYTTNGTEYAVIGALPGDQVFPDLAVNTNGGFVVWQDNATDGDGSGISARRVDGTLSGVLSAFRVNAQGTNDQENPRVASLKNGGAVFVWQGGLAGYQHIYARFLATNSTFLTTTDLLVSTFSSTNSFQVNPAVAVLNNSNVVIVWSSFNQAGSNSLQDVYAKILSPVGVTVSNQFLVNQFTNYNQRTPAVAALKNGGFVVAWVSEQQVAVVSSSINESNGTSSAQITLPSVGIYARLYQSNGVAIGNEFSVAAGSSPCANPSVAAASDGSFMVAWSGRDMAVRTNGWDVYARPFSSTGTGGTTTRLNSYLSGNQYAPRLSAIGLDYLAVWTSLKQDGSREGVYGQFVHSDSSLVGGELRMNTTTVSQQMHPVVASDGASQFIAVWTGYIGGATSFDLFAQRYINVDAVLLPMSAPFVYAPFTLSNGVYQPQLQVSWSLLVGISVSNYEVYVDGSATPTGVVASNQWLMTSVNGLTNSSTHSFQIGYVKTDGKHSPLSAATTGTTWSGLNWGGIPFEWMAAYFGNDGGQWPSATGDNDGDGISNLKEFISGTIPTNSASVLRVQLTKTGQGMFLNWPTMPGMTYQVQVTTNLTTWSNLGSPRFAAGTTDSIYVGGGTAGYYQVMLLRQ